jgi:Holliday junction resolvase
MGGMSKASNYSAHKSMRRVRKSKSYERELKRILQGDVETLENATRTCSEDEKESYFKAVDEQFVVIRSAGSLGVDIVALRGTISLPIEVKSSVKKTIRLAGSPHLKEQLHKFEEACDRSGLLAIYAFRRKSVRGDSWRLYTLQSKTFKGILRGVYAHLEKMELSRDGYYIIRWENGTPLNEFIKYLSHIS